MVGLVLRHQTGEPFESHAGDKTALFSVRNQLGSPSDKPTIADFKLDAFGLRHDLECRRAVVADSLRAFQILR
jgi:hypothetical protein